MNNNKKKNIQLGMPYGTAVHRLRKTILFSLVQETKRDICYRCNKKIDNIDNFSIEHKIPWLDSEDSIELFFDLNNIAFSHLTCNIGDARKPTKIESPEGYAWCGECKQHKLLKEFLLG